MIKGIIIGVVGTILVATVWTFFFCYKWWEDS